MKGAQWMDIRSDRQKGLSYVELGRKYHMDPRTAKRYAESPQKPEYTLSEPKPTKMELYKQIVDEWLEEAPYSALRILEKLRKMGFDGGYGIVKAYVRNRKMDLNEKATVRFETTPGKQGQMDWGFFEDHLVYEDGRWKKLYCFLMILGYSRMRYIEFVTDMSTNTLIQCNQNVFRYFGGYPEEILYDNMKHVVIKRLLKQEDSTLNRQFEDFSGFYGFKPILCRPYRGQTKGGRYPYVYVDGIYLRWNWGGEYENVAILVAIAVNEDGYREILGAAEGMKEDKASRVSFFQWLRGRGLDRVKLVVGDKCLGMLEAVGEVFPEAQYQRCIVHFYRNVFSVVPRSKVKLVAKMLKAIHAQESKKAAREKAKAVVKELRSMKLKEAAKKVEDGIEETFTYCDFPSEHWSRIRTNNVIERLNRESRRRTRMVGCFPDGNSALILVCARLRHVASTQWGNKKYMNMKYLEMILEDLSIAG